MGDYSEEAIEQLMKDFAAGNVSADMVVSILHNAYIAMVEERDLALATCTEFAEQSE